MRELDKVVEMVAAGRLKGADKIGVRVGKGGIRLWDEAVWRNIRGS